MATLGTVLATLSGAVRTAIHLLARFGVLTGALLVAASGCATHDVYSFSFRKAEVTIGERGIAIPVPPPSLTDAPVQPSNVDVDVDYELEAAATDEDAPMVELHVRDRIGGEHAVVDVEASVPQIVRVEGLVLDHSRNCLEVWLETDDGARSDAAYFHTVIESDDVSVRVEAGCPVAER